MILHEHDDEPIRGLPGRLPAGETVLWQGAPDWRLVARRVLHLPLLAGYFGLLLAARVATQVLNGATLGGALLNSLWLLPVVLAVLLLGLGFAWGVARTSVYTITNRRVVFRIGVALSMAANIPFEAIQSAALKRYEDGSGDLTLTLAPPHRVAYAFFWPHARPWRLARPEPGLRALANVEAVAQVLARALAGASALPVRPIAAPAAQPVSGVRPAPTAA